MIHNNDTEQIVGAVRKRFVGVCDNDTEQIDALIAIFAIFTIFAIVAILAIMAIVAIISIKTYADDENDTEQIGGAARKRFVGVGQDSTSSQSAHAHHLIVVIIIILFLIHSSRPGKRGSRPLLHSLWWESRIMGAQI